MADKMTREQRHRCMSRIRGRDTKPEMVVRRWLWHQGFRYRLCVKALPGSPDIVMRKWRTAIFVNGCFWHGHRCQKHVPETNAEFWQEKIKRNRERDARNQALLQAAGWHVIVVWECQLSPKRRSRTLRALDLELSRIVLERNKRRAKPYALPDQDSELPMAAEATTEYTTRKHGITKKGRSDSL
jgi:DNA mismatch endonuclease (patch repair protein)